MYKDFLDYINELIIRIRKVIIVFIIALLIFLVIPSAEFFNDQRSNNPLFYDLFIFWLIRTMVKAYLPAEFKLFVPSPTSPLFVMIQLALLLALAITIPFAFYELYAFISPALYKREKKVLKKYLLPFALLYLIGLIFTLVLVLPLTFRALTLFYEPLGLAPLINLNDFINTVVILTILGGLLFATPSILLPLIEIGVISTRVLSKYRILIYLIIAFIAGLISPDPTFLSLLPLLFPVYLLYEITIYIGKRIEKKSV